MEKNQLQLGLNVILKALSDDSVGTAMDNGKTTCRLEPQTTYTRCAADNEIK